MSLIQTDKNRLVLGLGSTGLATMRFLQQLGLPFRAMDTREELANIEAIKQQFADVEVYLGAKYRHVIEQADEIYLSPGVAMDDPLLATAIERGASITGDMDLFARHANAPVIAITGSNAKSTVTSLVGEMAVRQGLNVGVGGNLGTPMLDLIAPDRDAYVLEVSSFQLERMHSCQIQVAAILNMSDDHLDRHQTMMRYHQAKQRIYNNANIAVFNRDDRLTFPLVREGLQQHSFGEVGHGMDDYGLREIEGKEYIVKGAERVMALDAIRLPGRHNVFNVMAALAIGDAAGFEQQPMLEAIAVFAGLPHRCEMLGSVDGVRYINDSKATNIGATVAAINGLIADLEGHLILIAGGQAKGADLAPLAEIVARQGCEVILLGEDADKIAAAMDAGRVSVHRVDDMPAAVNLAHRLASTGDIVLLSPACASLDMFDSYEHRGRLFAAEVQALGAKL